MKWGHKYSQSLVCILLALEKTLYISFILLKVFYDEFSWIQLILTKISLEEIPVETMWFYSPPTKFGRQPNDKDSEYEETGSNTEGVFLDGYFVAKDWSM